MASILCAVKCLITIEGAGTPRLAEPFPRNRVRRSEELWGKMIEERNVGRSGLRVSAVGLGGNNFGGRLDFEATRRVVHKALDLGITFFDTSDWYPFGKHYLSEEYLGSILGDRRKDIVLATKFGSPLDDSGKRQGASRRYLLSAVEGSLERLKTDWIDLYQLHEVDPRTPIEETLSALDDLVRQGKVRYIGSSNMPAWQVVEAQWLARRDQGTAFISCQDEYSVLVRRIEPELIPAIKAYQLGLLTYFPLAAGLLTGKYKRSAPVPEDARLSRHYRHTARFLTEQNWQRVEALREFCEERGHTLLELAVNWLLNKPVVSSIIMGASTPEQLDQNVRAIAWHLSPEELAEIDRRAL
jgi:aryl-alcohol dehydrogenase-like predicted oxidoreductase